MSKLEKILDKARNQPNNFRFDDLIWLAEQVGFVRSRQRGSHVMLDHPGLDVEMNFQEAKGKAKPYQIRQLLAFIDEHGLGDR